MIRNLIALVLCGLSIGWLMGMSVSPVVQNVLTSVLAIVVSVLGLLAGVSPKTEGQPSKESKGRADTPNVETHVLGNVVTVLIENKVVASGATGEDGIDKKPSVAPKSTALWPIALFLVFLSVGSAGGVFTRTNDLLGVKKARFLERWETLMPVQATHEDSTKLMSHLFYKIYGISPGTKHDGSVPMSTQPDNERTTTNTQMYNTSHSTECDELLGRTGEPLRAKLRHEKNPLVQLLMSKNLTDEELEQIKNELCQPLKK